MSGPYVRSAILVGALPLMAEWGQDARALAAELGIDPAALRDPDLPVPVGPLLQFYELAALRAGCRSFGLRMAARTGITVVGSLWILLRQAQTVGQMLEDLAANFDLYTQAALVSLQPEGRARRLSWTTRTGVAASEVQMAEYSIAVLCSEIRRHAPADWEPASVRFRHGAPPDRAELRRVLGPNLQFDASDNSLLIEPALLDRPLRGAGSRTRALLRHVLRTEQEPIDPGLVERVDGVIRALLPYARCTLADLSRALGMAPRTLQEHLHSRGRSFQDIRDQVRLDLAAKYLRDSRLSLTQIADVLGYSELSAFSRAFRRWHGVSARSLRQRAMAESRPTRTSRLPR